jgi:hypothetical protein
MVGGPEAAAGVQQADKGSSIFLRMRPGAFELLVKGIARCDGQEESFSS